MDKRQYMYLAFYRSDQESATWLDKLISFVTGSVYSHVELSDRKGKCFSVSPRDRSTRYKKINIFNKKKWNLVKVYIAKDDFEQNAQKWENHKYDYPGAITSPIPIHIQFRNRVFCSELAATILHNSKVDEFKKPYTIYPGKLYRILAENKTGEQQ